MSDTSQTTPVGVHAEAPLPAERRPEARRAGPRHTALWRALYALLLVTVLALLPPLISLSRYQRRITQSMSQILGRPVHMARISLHLLPFPSFRIENLVIEETAPFGNEPVLRAAIVDARLRIMPLWHRRVEFSRLSFHEPSVNLTRTAGRPTRWNLESVLLQAAHIEAAPTAQAYFSDAPRFPYIEADGARVNLKVGAEKTPFSVTDADFALWLPEPNEWRMRLRAHPARTDTSAADTGVLQVEATLQKAPALARIPIDLTFSWTGAPLGEASRVTSGRDANLRGDLSVQGSVRGSLDDAALQSTTQIESLHRSDFVPDHAIDLNVTCTAHLTHILHTAEALRCRWPLPDAKDAPVIVSGGIPDLEQPSSAQLLLAAPRVSAATALRLLRTVSDRVSPTLQADGSLAVEAHWSGATSAPVQTTLPQHTAAEANTAPGFNAQLLAEKLTLSGGRLAQIPVILSDLRLLATWQPDASGNSQEPPRVVLEPTRLELEPDHIALLRGTGDNQGLEGSLTGSVPLDRLSALGAVLPMFGDGLEDLRSSSPPRPSTPRDATLRDATALVVERPWGQPQVWSYKKLSAGDGPARPLPSQR